MLLKSLVYAHRGASKLAPENTMPAFELALEMGADGIETDVQLTKDNIPVLIHDENVRRTTNGTGFVQDYTLRELQKLDAGSWFSKKYKNSRIVSLDEFLAWIKNTNMLINLELKNNVIDYKDIEKIVYDRIVAYNLVFRTVISCFNPKSIERWKDIDKNMATAFLTSQKIKGLIPFTEELGATGLHIRYRLLNNNLIKQCHEQELAVRVYTVNRPSQIMRCFKLGCDAIITDVPQVALEYRKTYLQNHPVK
ncbi:glycerophosphodiester phosphodiesterase [Radiobacillus sp. PE A8.2]|uniref:glycerophosphodiester phosphodiesterase n=1 Tax=Radiobacillus sp. PE A8.2 TaxID=3380349 RepID=UPI00388FE680